MLENIINHHKNIKTIMLKVTDNKKLSKSELQQVLQYYLEIGKYLAFQLDKEYNNENK